MNKRFLVPIFVFLFILIGFFVVYLQVNNQKPDFKSIENISERKQAFINYLLPYINTAEEKVCKQRATIQAKLNLVDSGQKLSTNENNAIANIAKIYGLEVQSPITKKDFQEILMRVNVIPKGLVIAQSVLETGWGTSRFAADYNNYFGQHCFKEGCGVKPKNQASNKVDEVAIYRSPEESISGYLLLLNSSKRYQALREIRLNLLSQNKAVSSIALIDGLGSYSEIGLDEYKNRLISVIEYNKLTQYDQFICGASK